MLWLILSVVLGLIAIGFALLGDPGWKIGVPLVAAAVWVVLSIFLSIHSVGQRQVGIVYNFSGTISGKKDPGVVMTMPWQHVKTENVGIQKDVFNFDQSNSAVSKDQQPIEAVLVVNYQVEPAQVVKLYKEVGPSWKTILLDGRVPQDFKETTAQFSSPDITLQRTQLRKIFLRRLRGELNKYDIHVVDAFINNVGYSPEYTKAIEQKLVQRQAAQTAEAKVAQATAEADQVIAKARGDAKSIELQGQALRNNPDVLRLKAIEKLAPKAQVIYCSTGDCPSILGSIAPVTTPTK